MMIDAPVRVEDQLIELMIGWLSESVGKDSLPRLNNILMADTIEMRDNRANIYFYQTLPYLNSNTKKPLGAFRHILRLKSPLAMKFRVCLEDEDKNRYILGEIQRWAKEMIDISTL